MKLLLLIPACLAILTLPPESQAAPRASQPALPRSTPEAQGVSSSNLLDFVDAADRQLDSMHSVMILRHGHVIAEGWWSPYNADSNHELYSLSKSFTSTAVGIAIAEKKLSLDDEVLKFFPDDAPKDPSANLKSMRVRDLLSMSAGHQDETSSAPDKISPRSFLAHPVPHKPGTHFKYNTPATFMLSAIVQKQTGQSVLEYLRPRLFDPLGIANPTWDTNTQGVSLGGYGLRVRTEDIARLGQLYLQKGRWNGRQLLPATWVAAATARQTSNGSSPTSDWDQGYGYQFWRSRHDAYRGDGAFGQYCIVLPDQDAVIAITSGLGDMQAVLNLVWDKLLPGIKPSRVSGDSAAQSRLKDKLAGLVLHTAEGKTTSPALDKILGHKYVFPTNDQNLTSLTIRKGTGPNDLVLETQGVAADTRITCGYKAWIKNRGPFGPYPSEALAACAAWSADDTLTLRICAYETPYVMTLRLKFTGDEVVHEAKANVGFGATTRPAITGRTDQGAPVTR